MGNQIDWIIFGTNTKIMRGQIGFWPDKKLKVRAQYHNTRQVTPTGTSAGGSLSNEFSLINEWFLSERIWINSLLGYSAPAAALARSGLSNPFAALNSETSPLGARRSVDVVLAVGFSF